MRRFWVRFTDRVRGANYCYNSQVEGNHWAPLYPLVVEETPLLCVWTKGHQCASLCTVDLYDMYLIFKFTEGNPWVYLINIVLDGISLLYSEVYYFSPQTIALLSSMGLGLMFIFYFSKSLFLSLWWFLLGETLLVMVLGIMGCPFWENIGWITDLNDIKDLRFWFELITPTDTLISLLNLVLL